MMILSAWSVVPAVFRRSPAALLVVMLALALAGAAVAAMVASTVSSTDVAPAGDLLLGPFRWTPLANRGLA
jgi:hypothetical protein